MATDNILLWYQRSQQTSHVIRKTPPDNMT